MIQETLHQEEKQKIDDFPPTVRSQYSPRVPVRLDTGPGLTQQHFKEEVDINRIVKKFMETGEIPLATKQAEFGFASSMTFTEAMQITAQAKEEFMKLPAKVRSHFKNDPALYLDAASDPEERHTFIDLGLLEADPEEKPPEGEGTPLPTPETPIDEANDPSSPK